MPRAAHHRSAGAHQRARHGQGRARSSHVWSSRSAYARRPCARRSPTTRPWEIAWWEDPVAGARTRNRAGRREAVFDLRGACRSDRARQGAEAGGVRAQAVFWRKAATASFSTTRCSPEIRAATGTCSRGCSGTSGGSAACRIWRPATAAFAARPMSRRSAPMGRASNGCRSVAASKPRNAPPTKRVAAIGVCRALEITAFTHFDTKTS